MLPTRILSRLYFSIPCLALFTLLSCNQEKHEEEKPRPKLVIGMVVDQMRFDYLQRFAPVFSNEGAFKLLIDSGKFFTETRYEYLPTYTGPGHATIFTGTHPKYHGIVANDWYYRQGNKMMYCASDSTVDTQGSPSGAGQMSPKNMLVQSLGDLFKNEFGTDSKVYGVGLKDRSSIFPAGKQANRAFWFDGGKQGKWISSSYYTDAFPTWIENFNASGICDSLMAVNWELHDRTKLLEITDATSWERPFQGMQQAIFPYELSKLGLINGNYEMLKQVPHGNDLTLSFAKALIENEELGADSIPDFLSISFSATDYVGHRFGTESLELADTYVRLDESLGEFIRYLNEKIGAGNYMIFLSSDHGAAPPVGYAQSKMQKGGAISVPELEVELDSVLTANNFPTKSVLALANQQVYLAPMDSIKKQQAISLLSKHLMEKVFVEEILTADMLGKGVPSNYSGRHYNAATAGYRPDRCGDLWYFLKEYWVEYSEAGSTHGSFEEYDRHVPFFIYNQHLPAEKISRSVAVRDIAPTLSDILGLQGLESFSGRSVFAKP
ncbi:MAG: alkaline phosphatase family protein [Luteibaculum sp.]